MIVTIMEIDQVRAVLWLVRPVLLTTPGASDGSGACHSRRAG
jgi:hypothetical protein